jgi:hypothetical protein
MATQLVSSVLGFFRKCYGETSAIECSRHPHRNSLPQEILEHILNFVCNPTRTALVSKHFCNQSKHSYKVLLGQYEYCPFLNPFIPTEKQPREKVQAVYLSIIREARSCGIDPKDVEPALLPLAQERLAEIRRLTITRLYDKFHVYRTILHALNSEFTQIEMTMQGTIEFSEKSLKSREALYSHRPNKLDLGYCRLTYLPPLIGQLKALKNLNLHDNDLTVLPTELKALTKLTTLHLNGNPLLPENVKNVCQSLPRLKTVFIDNEQPDLIKMFQTHLPNLQLHVVRILRIEEEI